jgi:PTH1 family peptidyl-tRNA hydrolase
VPTTKVIVGLGNPGPKYSTTRHNVGWWFVDRLAEAWSLGRFRRQGSAAVTAGHAHGVAVQVVKPQTYMNRSGAALAPLRRASAFDIAQDLLVVIDDVALEPGRVRLRPSGSAGGHNGLKSVEASLGTRDYARLRIGVGSAPAGRDLAGWVLASPPKADRQAILELFPDLIEGVSTWMTEGVEAAMNRCNR